MPSISLFPTASFLSFLVLTAAILGQPTLAQAPASIDPDRGTEAFDNPDPRSLTQDGSFLSLEGGKRLMEEANAAIDTENYDLAVTKLQESRQVFNQLSNFYQELAGSFSGIDNRISDGQRRLALNTAQMRDEATYRLALVHRSQNQPELAVPLLIQIVRSQQPTRDLGKRAYQQLLELGFVDTPYPRRRSGAETSSR